MGEEVTAAMAMMKIEDHIDSCAQNYAAMTGTFKEVRGAIRDTNRMLIAFIAAVFGTVVVFAGYSYVQDQSLHEQLVQARVSAATAATAAQEIPDKTVQKLQAIRPSN